jgi:hypothetical protein
LDPAYERVGVICSEMTEDRLVEIDSPVMGMGFQVTVLVQRVVSSVSAV